MLVSVFLWSCLTVRSLLSPSLDGPSCGGASFSLGSAITSACVFADRSMQYPTRVRIVIARLQFRHVSVAVPVFVAFVVVLFFVLVFTEWS